MGTERNVVSDGFHKHLDACQQCADHPFALCPTGSVLLRASATEEQARVCNLCGAQLSQDGTCKFCRFSTDDRERR